MPCRKETLRPTRVIDPSRATPACGNDQARQVRDSLTWFDSPAKESDTAVEQRNELLNLLDERWYPLANGFRAAGIPAPRDVDWDIVIDARVSGQRALMVWVFHCEMWDELHSKILWMEKWRLKMKLRQYSIWAMA